MRSEERLARFERYAEWPLAAAALTFLITFSIQVLSPRPPDQAHLLWLIGWFIWALFIADYAVRLWLAPQRLFWFTRHLLDLAIVALPLVRPLRLLRLLFLIGILQRAIGNALRGKILVYTVSGVAILIYTSSLAVFDEERYLPGATITTFGRALWWSVSTVTTVGYGDVYPITNTGRIIAVLLMIGGISLVGVVTASIASWIIQRVAEEEEAEAKEFTEVHLEELRDEIRAVGRQLRVLSDRIGDQRSAGGAQVDRSVDDDPVDLP